MNLKIAFKNHCLEKKLQINESQINTINLLSKFYEGNKFSLLKLFNNNSKKFAFYLRGDVGVGKTMILDFFFNYIDTPKQRFHFNEFMINFHNFRHSQEKRGEKNSIDIFVKELKKKTELIYLDEFQVTNIVDAMILGKLFEIIIKENIKIIITSNTKIENLYKDGLQREQFLPFVNLIKKFSIEHELVIDEDYRKIGIDKLERFFYPLNEKINFKINQLFREITKNKIHSIKKIKVKGREYNIQNYFEGTAKFEFQELCNQNIGGEDYIEIANLCNFIAIQNIPSFNDENINMQQRFVTLIDIFYEKRIPLLMSSNCRLDELTSSKKLKEPFKRTLSRIYELTSPEIKIV
tara:strand:+ start:206 stop:1258 length:1053 start_codon:yes stop_codon:yes gene_type:complete